MRKASSSATDASQTGLTSGLKRLITNPKRFGAVNLWKALKPDERMAAATSYLADEASGRERLNRIVARARNFRPATVRKWPEEKIVKAIRHVPLNEPRVAAPLLRCHHVPGQRAMVIAFLDGLGVSHDKGKVDSLSVVDADEEVVRSATREIVEEFGLRAAAVYLLTLRFFGAPAGDLGRAWLQELLEAPGAEAAVEADESAATEEEAVDGRAEDDHREQDDPTRQPSFTTLDRLLILAAVDTAQGIEGALSEDQLDDVVDELVTLNGRRHQSYFHAGFRDVLFDKPVGEELPAANQSRLRWYWTGAVQGWARRERWDCIVREHATNPVIGELGSGSTMASLAAVRHIAEAFRREGQTTEIAQLVKVRALVGQPGLFKLLLDAATDLLGKGDAAKALPLFELLMKTREELENRGVSPAERMLLDAHRRMAHCLRHLHQHRRARTLLGDLLKQDPDPNIHAMVHADLGLLAGGFDALEEVVLPLRRDEFAGFVNRLAKGAEHFRQSVNIDTAYSAHGHYCLGVLALGRAVDDHEFTHAERHLQSTRIRFSETADSYSNSLVEHANLYFGIAKAQQLSPNKLAHAADVMTRSMASGARMPDYLTEQTIEALALAEEKDDLHRVVSAIIDEEGDRVLDELAKCESALDHCPTLCHALKARAQSKGIASSAQAGDLRSALHGFQKQGNPGAAAEALDELDKLAQDGVGVREFLELLEHRSRYEPAWDRDDATIARARCLEARGRFLDAVHVLQDLFHRLATQEREAGLGDAAGVLDRIRGYGIDPSSYSNLTDRYNALAAQESEAVPSPEGEPVRGVRVLVVGGGEQQARAEDMVRQKLRDTDPHIRVTFIQTGWSENWRRKFGEIEGAMASHDALVVMRFMRTHLGRRIRAKWTGGTWRSCWGGGHGAIVGAVTRVAAAVRYPC